MGCLSTVDSSSDSDTDKECQDRFRQAVIDVSDLVKPEGKARVSHLHQPRKKVCVSTKPSLRPAERFDDDENNPLQTTPGFRAHVAKKLGELIDGRVTENPLCQSAQNADLCSVEDSSSNDLELMKGVPLLLERKTIPHNPRKRRASSSSSSDEDERVKQAAISVDVIMSTSALHNYTTTPGGGESPHITTKSAVSETFTAEVESKAVTRESEKSPKKKKKKKKKKQGSSEMPQNKTVSEILNTSNTTADWNSNKQSMTLNASKTTSEQYDDDVNSGNQLMESVTKKKKKKKKQKEGTLSSGSQESSKEVVTPTGVSKMEEPDNTSTQCKNTGRNVYESKGAQNQNDVKMKKRKKSKKKNIQEGS